MKLLLLVFVGICAIFNPVVAFTMGGNGNGNPFPGTIMTELNLFGKQSKGGGTAASNLPKPDPSDPDRFIPPTLTLSGKDADADFYPTYISVVRNGPLPFFTRLADPDKYSQAIYKYQYDTKETDLQEAQANMDAYFSSPDVWAEQKLRESRGEREVYKYNQPLNVERVTLSVVWGSFVVGILGKVIWKGVLHL